MIRHHHPPAVKKAMVSRMLLLMFSHLTVLTVSVPVMEKDVLSSMEGQRRNSASGEIQKTTAAKARHRIQTQM
jgi:hypothetical protein